MKGKLVYNRSSYLVSLPLLAVCALLCMLAAFWGQTLLAGVFMLLTLLGLLSRLWASASVRGVSVQLTGGSTGLFPGESTRFTLRVENDKLLPVLWMELFFPLAPDLCLTPEECRAPEEWERPVLTEGGYALEQVGETRLPAFLWYETRTVTCVWNANRRGIYSTAGWRLRTGDGFGLAQMEVPLAGGGARELAVFPKLVEVSSELFLRSLWNAETGERGVMEDVTVLRSTRSYQSTDSVKRINWRLVARGLPLTVNVYEEILPHSVHFLLDGDSYFAGPNLHPEELEEALSILASELVALEERQVSCGLSLPRGRREPENLFSQSGLEEKLWALAAYQPQPVKREPEGGAIIPNLPGFRSAPILEAAQRVGRFYYIAYDAESLKNRTLLNQLGWEQVTILTTLDCAPYGDYECICLNRLRGGDDRE